MTASQLVNILLSDGAIERVSVNRYRIRSTYYTRTVAPSYISENSLYTRPDITRILAEGEDPDGFRLRSVPATPSSRYYVESDTRPTQRVVRRTITRNSYHSTGGGTSRTGIREALAAIPFDSDGVRRSFGLEYEIYSLTEEQEDKLARLLDTLPAHVTERDASLQSTGVEIVFLPMSAAQYIDTWNKLKQFVQENHVSMDSGSSNMAGAHTTYGVSNSSVSTDDLQIRLNRLALAVKSVGTQRQIKALFGRDFGNYRSLPNSTTTREHSNAFSASRGDSAWECRLCSWNGDAEKIVEFLKATEFVFNRVFRASDFVRIFEIMGCDTTEA